MDSLEKFCYKFLGMTGLSLARDFWALAISLKGSIDYLLAVGEFHVE